MSAQGTEPSLRAAIQWVDDGAWWYWDLGGGTVSCSPRWYLNLGLEPNDGALPIETLFRLIHPGDREVIDDAVRAALSDGSTSYDLRLRLRHREGHFVVVRSWGVIEVKGPVGLRTARLTGVHEPLERRGWWEGVTDSAARQPQDRPSVVGP